MRLVGDSPDMATVADLRPLAAWYEREVRVARELQVPAWEDAAVREALQQARSPLFIATPGSTRLEDDGVDKFSKPFDLLLASLARKGAAAGVL